MDACTRIKFVITLFFSIPLYTRRTFVVSFMTPTPQPSSSDSCPDDAWYDTLESYVENRNWNAAYEHIQPYQDCDSDMHTSRLLSIWSKHGLSGSEIERILIGVTDRFWSGFRSMLIWIFAIIAGFVVLGIVLAFSTRNQ